MPALTSLVPTRRPGRAKIRGRSGGSRPRPGRLWCWLTGLAALTAVGAVSLAPPASAMAPRPSCCGVRVGGPASTGTVVENWAAPSLLFRAANQLTQLNLVPIAGASDGTALKLQLNALPVPGPSGAGLVTSNRLYRYGTFGTRMRTADCAGQDHPGVVTGAFTYSPSHADANRNGISDNDEIDVEFLCGQPDVVYLSLWTDYSETSDNLSQITRAINLRTGQVLLNCYLIAYSSGCQPLLAGENTPTSTTPIPGFSSEKQFRTYWFDWQPDHVTFYATDSAGYRVLLWDYRGPRSRIPSLSSSFMQNVTYTRTWNPLNGPAHNQPTLDTAAYIDATIVPRTAVLRLIGFTIANLPRVSR